MAGITHLEEFQKPALRGLVDESVQDRTVTLADTFLPNVEVFSNKFAYDIIKNSKHIGAMIGYGSEPPVVDRNAVASMSGEIAKMGIKYIATEEELLGINQARSDAERQSVIDSLTIEGVQLVQAIQRRIDVIKMEAVAKGTFSYNKNGVKVNVDFGIPAEHKKDITGDTTTWDDSSHDILADLLAWAEEYEANTGQSPENILMSRQAFSKLLKNEQMIVESGRPEGALRTSQENVQSVLQAYGLPTITILTDRKVTVKDMYSGEDETIEYMPENRVVFVSTGLGEFLIGPTVENEFEPGIVLEAKDKDEPIQSVLRSVAAGFPAIKSPELLLHADVYPVS